MNRPNIILAIADDQSWPYASAYGTQWVRTPAFDRIAEEGVLFANAYAPAPHCAPSRASLLTGRNIWQNREAGTHASLFPADLETYPEILQKVGYHVGFTGKPWAPGTFSETGRQFNPSGPEYNRHTLIPPTSCISRLDYTSNFEDFLDENDKDQPFCFWYGAYEPHRPYEEGSALRAGKNLNDVEVPQFLPDEEDIRSDLLDYALEIEWFDSHLGKIMAVLDQRGLAANTIIVVTSDNGLPFPRAKANNYDAGAHVPFAVSWPARIPGNRKVTDFMSFIDLAPTFLDAAGIDIPNAMSGVSLLPVLESSLSGQVDASRDFALSGRERHTHARYDNRGYPIRAIHTADYLYIRNLENELWPAGDLFDDVDDSPTKGLLIRRRDEKAIKNYFDAAFGKRPGEELFDLKNDPACMQNLAENPEYRDITKELWARLKGVLLDQKDPRILGYGCLFDAYPRVSFMRTHLGGFVKRGQYNSKYLEAVRDILRSLGCPEIEISDLCEKPDRVLSEDPGPINR